MRTLALLPLLVLVAAGGEPRGEWPRPVRIGSGVSGHIHPAVCVTKKGTVLVVHSQSDFRNLRLTRSDDGGRTWTWPVAFPGTEKLEIYPGSLTVLRDGRVVHAWNTWYKDAAGKKSRFVQFSISSDEGKSWGDVKSLAKNANATSVVRHPLVELDTDDWLFSLSDRTIHYNPKTGVETKFGDGAPHGLVPIVRTPKGTFVSGSGKRSTDGGKTWARVEPFPKIGADGWRYDMTCLENGWLIASEVLGPGFGGDCWRFVVSRDDGATWDFANTVEFYNPGRPIGGRACPRTVQLDRDTLGTVYYDIDPKQDGGAGVFFLRTPLQKLMPPRR
jgi:hypothetical protein